MKSCADDYYMDGVGVEMKMVRRSLYLYELWHIHSNSGWRPSWDIYETEDELIVLVEMGKSMWAESGCSCGVIVAGLLSMM